MSKWTGLAIAITVFNLCIIYSQYKRPNPEPISSGIIDLGPGDHKEILREWFLKDEPKAIWVLPNQDERVLI